jgi:hypothetical protein
VGHSFPVVVIYVTGTSEVVVMTSFFRWLASGSLVVLAITTLVGLVLILLSVVISRWSRLPSEIAGDGSLSDDQKQREFARAKRVGTARELLAEAGFACLIIFFLHHVAMIAGERRSNEVTSLVETRLDEKSSKMLDEIKLAQLINLPKDLNDYARTVLMENPFYYSGVKVGANVADNRKVGPECLIATLSVDIVVHNRSSVPQEFSQAITYNDISKGCGNPKHTHFWTRDNEGNTVLEFDETRIRALVQARGEGESSIEIPTVIPAGSSVTISSIAEIPTTTSDHFFWHTRFPTTSAEVTVYLPLDLVDVELVQGFPTTTKTGTQVQAKSGSNPQRIIMSGGVMPGQAAVFVWKKKGP